MDGLGLTVAVGRQDLSMDGTVEKCLLRGGPPIACDPPPVAIDDYGGVVVNTETNLRT